MYIYILYIYIYIHIIYNIETWQFTTNSLRIIEAKVNMLKVNRVIINRTHQYSLVYNLRCGVGVGATPTPHRKWVPRPLTMAVI